MSNFKEILRSKGLSVTQARIDMLEALSRLEEPCTIESLKNVLNTPVHSTTLYRSLKTLVDVGIVYQTDFRDGVAYFEFQEDTHHHHHLTCTRCKKRISIDICIHEFIPIAESTTGFTITNHLLEFFGLCPNCQGDGAQYK